MKNVCHKKPVSPETFIHDYSEESSSHHRRSEFKRAMASITHNVYDVIMQL